ncbi:extracellular catalytic domain type 1 short-chain-length polyhydroxyalkanoate depolymerase [Methylibium sp.]|uniref:extracellular catalytic domain type 1 short-chain-length polyhydroxyalkanoate depolymerase n=1 Tax=Methylibium sp. TaxID=2067992 RepID=UPI003D0A44E9
MNDTLQNLMRAAARLTQAGRLNEATQALQRALRGAAGADAMRPATARTGTPGMPAAGTAAPEAEPLVIDGCVFEMDAPAAAAASAPPASGSSPADGPQARTTPAPQGDAEATPPTGRGEFTGGSYTHGSQTRRYKLYSPPGPAGRRLPLVVMLHGCTQDPDDFAAGTGMNERAREQGFFVLYPAQSQSANPQRCWNWFKHNHQQRDRGEPALIATLTQAVMKQHGIDPRRVYIAGLSAGGAMAAIVAAAYPDLFAAVGVHSGLPGGAASDVAGALAVMKTGVAGPGLKPRARTPGAAPATAAPTGHVPTIVFHGDQDPTVHPRNGEQVISAALDSAAAGAGASPTAAASSPRVERGVSARGRHYTRSVHPGGEGRALAEHWLVHGAGHAWSGGQAEGSYTDASGPDATSEMLRFFFEHPRGH